MIEQKVYEMYTNGLSLSDIAITMDIPISEIFEKVRNRDEEENVF